MPGERSLAEIDVTEPDEWDLDVRLGELGTLLCGCGDHDVIEFVPTGGGGTCNTSNDTCPNTCAGATCAPTCPGTCRPTCAGATCAATCPGTCRPTCGATCACGPTNSATCNNTHCFTCRSGCRTP